MIEFDIRPSDHPVPDAEREEKLRSPGFGQLFTDHMITLRWSTDSGWHDGRLEPYGPFTLDPATSVLDPFCRSHEVDNLFVVDGSFMPTSGGVPSTLTIMANAFRVADHVVQRLRAGTRI